MRKKKKIPILYIIQTINGGDDDLEEMCAYDPSCSTIRWLSASKPYLGISPVSNHRIIN